MTILRITIIDLLCFLKVFTYFIIHVLWCPQLFPNYKHHHMKIATKTHDKLNNATATLMQNNRTNLIPAVATFLIQSLIKQFDATGYFLFADCVFWGLLLFCYCCEWAAMLDHLALSAEARVSIPHSNISAVEINIRSQQSVKGCELDIKSHKLTSCCPLACV